MKKWIAVLILLLLCSRHISINFSSGGYRHLLALDLQPHYILFVARYPNFTEHSIETQQTLIRIYLQSKNKYRWFPEIYPAPKRGKAVIRPRNYTPYDEYRKQQLEGEREKAVFKP